MEQRKPTHLIRLLLNSLQWPLPPPSEKGADPLAGLARPSHPAHPPTFLPVPSPKAPCSALCPPPGTPSLLRSPATCRILARLQDSAPISFPCMKLLLSLALSSMKLHRLLPDTLHRGPQAPYAQVPSAALSCPCAHLLEGVLESRAEQVKIPR